MRGKLLASCATIKPLFRYDSMWRFGIPPADNVWSWSHFDGWHWRSVGS